LLLIPFLVKAMENPGRRDRSRLALFPGLEIAEMLRNEILNAIVLDISRNRDDGMAADVTALIKVLM